MGHSSLIGTDPAAPEPAGRDTAALGPSDSSDSGSDVAGAAERTPGDAQAPADVALGADAEHPAFSPDALHGASSDAAGTGERRAADADELPREAADIGVDRIVTPHTAHGLAAADAEVEPDAAALDALTGAPAGDPLDEEDEEEDDEEEPAAEQARRGRTRRPSARAVTQPTEPKQPNPGPDRPAPPLERDPAEGAEGEDEDEGDARRPGRAPLPHRG